MRDNLINKWYMSRNYQLVYSNMSLDSEAAPAATFRPIEWSESERTALKCSLSRIDQVFNWNIPINLNETRDNQQRRTLNDYRLFSRIRCEMAGGVGFDPTFLTIRRRASAESTETDIPNTSSHRYILLLYIKNYGYYYYY